MTKLQRVSLFLLRVSLGWIFFWAGITKILKPAWSAAGYLQNAKTFPDLFQWFASPTMLPLTNLVTEWGLLLLGVSLILGVCIRWSAPAGIVLMILFYLPILQFPYPNVNSFIVDEHIIYIIALIILAVFKAGHYWGLGKMLGRS